MIIRALRKFFFQYLIFYRNLVLLSDPKSYFYSKQDNSTLTTENHSIDDYYQNLTLLRRLISERIRYLYSGPDSSSDQFQTYHFPEESQVRPEHEFQNNSFNDQTNNRQKITEDLYPNQRSLQNLFSNSDLSRLDHTIHGFRSLNENTSHGNAKGIVTDENTFLHQEMQYLHPQEYQCTRENEYKDHIIESDSMVLDSENPNPLGSLIYFHQRFEYKSIMAPIEYLNKLCDGASTSNILDIDQQENFEKKWNFMVSTAEKYIATANNSELISKCKNEDKIKMISSEFNNYFREYSMTRFKTIDIYVFKRLNSMQEEYHLVFKSLVELDELNMNDKRENIKKFFSSTDMQFFFNESCVEEEQFNLHIVNIYSDMERIIQNIFLKSSACVFPTEYHSEDSEYTLKRLENRFYDEFRKLETQDTHISDILRICSYFVNYESKLCSDMDINMILKSLKIPKITETLFKLKECTKKNIFYEIIKFIELYEKNLEEFIRKNFVVSTVYLLNALIISLNKINSMYSQNKSRNKTCKKLKLSIDTNIFYIGKLFEQLLRNLENYETKANFYGMLNTLRFFLNIIQFKNNRIFLMFLHIPFLIAMVLDEAFLFDEIQIKEFIAFIIQPLKNKISIQSEFYNDKVQYFLEINTSTVYNIASFNILIIKKYVNIGLISKRSDKFVENFSIFFEKLIELEKNTPIQDMRLQKLYFSQLYLMKALMKKCNIYSINCNKISDLISNLCEKIHKFI